MPIDFVSTAERTAAIGPYSQAIVAGGFVFTAGQVGTRPRDRRAGARRHRRTDRAGDAQPRGHAPGGGLGPVQVVKTTVFLVDMADFAAMNEVYARAFGDHRPARSTVAVAGLPGGARVEIEAIAAP